MLWEHCQLWAEYSVIFSLFLRIFLQVVPFALIEKDFSPKMLIYLCLPRDVATCDGWASRWLSDAATPAGL